MDTNEALKIVKRAVTTTTSKDTSKVDLNLAVSVIEANLIQLKKGFPKTALPVLVRLASNNYTYHSWEVADYKVVKTVSETTQWYLANSKAAEPITKRVLGWTELPDV